MLLYYLPEGADKTVLPIHGGGRRQVNRGPDDGQGTVFSKQDGKIGYFPDDGQEWIDCGGYWLGKSGETKPEDLLNKEVIDGHYVTLEDGNKWLIPVARVFPVGTRLPEALILGPEGELVTEVLPRFAQFAKRANTLWEIFAAQIAEGEEKFTIRNGWDIAVEALSINYQLDGHSVSLLRLLTTANIKEVLTSVVDYPTIMEEMKKKDLLNNEPLDTTSLLDGEKG